MELHEESAVPRIIVGLGNPGAEYEWTRHNIGLHVVEEFGKRHGLTFHHERGVEAMMARGVLEGRPVTVAFPRTYMNESGRAVSRLMRFVHANADQLMVVIDDIETPWGNMKAVYGGGTRGHNGLRSVQGLLGTMQFTQLRFGVGRPGRESVAEYVLHRFTAEEMAQLPSLIEQAVITIEEWLQGGESASAIATGVM
jgi:PTH1 family peptidyl-tRNA hydrolase